MPIYRAVPIDRSDRICGDEQVFIAKSDIEAIAHAMLFADTQAVEVWDHEGRIGLIELREVKDEDNVESS